MHPDHPLPGSLLSDVPTSSPLYISSETCHILNLPTTLTSTVNSLFPEGQHPDPSMIRSDIYAYVSQDNTNISFTFVTSGAGNTNRIGFAKYLSSSHALDSTTLQFVWPKINTMSGGCLQQGDTYKFGPFKNGDMVIFFLDSNSLVSNRYWSYIDSPYFNNPDTVECACSTGYTHGSWAYLTQEDITLFGFEDLRLGDADYNDAMFFLTFQGGLTYNQVPPYENGTIKVCNTNTQVSQNSYAEVNCTQWGILESTTAQSCLTYMAIPSGWTWARDDDATAHAALTSLASTQWAYTSATCFLLSVNDAAGVGYTSSGAVCDPSTYTINSIYNATSGLRCYNAACTSRFVLKGTDLGAGCTAGGICLPGRLGSILSLTPTSSSGVVEFPTTYSVYIKAPVGNVSVSTSLQIPSGNKQMDVFIILDPTTAAANKMTSVASYFKSNVLSAFTSNSIDIKLGLAVFTPSGTTGYTLDSDYTLTSDTTTISSWADNKITPKTPVASCPTTNAMYSAMAYTLDVARGINWRNDAFHVLWVLSSCPMTESSDMRAAVNASGVMPVFGAVISSSGNYPSSGFDSSATFSGSYAPYSQVYKTKNIWSSSTPDVFNAASTSTTRGVAFIAGLWSTAFAYKVSDTNGFVTQLPTSAGTVGSNGLYTLSYSINWPTGLAVSQSVSFYSAVIRLIGRQTTSFYINFNHKPVLGSLTLPVNAGENRTVSLSPTDADGNILRLTVDTLPTKGSLYRSDNGAAITTAGTALPYGANTLIYGAWASSNGVDTFNVSVSDGCESVSAVVTMTVTKSNQPPVAQSFSITMLEDSTTAALNGLIDFAPYIGDPDNPAARQTLSVSLVSLPQPTTRGFLTTYTYNTAGTAINTLGAVANQTRFQLYQPSSNGTVTFTYKVNDGVADSNVATVTIIITHVNHPPALNIPVTTFQVQAGSGATSISATITDADGNLDTVNLYAVASTLTTYSTSGDATLNVNTPTDASPFKFFTNFWGPSPLTVTAFPVTGLSWNPNSGTGVQTVIFQAHDNSGAKSNNVTVTFNVTADTPPTWTSRPSTTTFTINQGSSLTGLFFAATDQDAPTTPPEWQNLVFTLQSKSSQASVRLLHSSTAGIYQNLTQGGDFGHTLSASASYVALDNTNSWSTYNITYVPDSSFYGTDTFSFIVRDIQGAYALESAVVNVQVVRTFTLPLSADTAIHGKENTLETTSIPLFSTNNVATAVKLQLVSFNFPGILSLDSGLATTWTVGQNTTATNTGSLSVYVKGNFGAYAGPNVPLGNFTYRVIEPGTPDLVGPTYTCQIYLEHVNHPPSSNNVAYTIKKRELLTISLPAQDSDVNDVAGTISALLKSFVAGYQGTFYVDAAKTTVLDSAFISSGGNLGTSRTFYYESETDYSTNNQPLARFTFIVEDQHGEPSVNTYSGAITVLPAGDPPAFGGALEVTTYQETPIPIVLNVAVTTETGAPAIVTLTTLPTRGDLFACDDASVCTKVTAVPFVHPGSNGRVVFSPRAYDWDMNFTHFNFTLTDSSSGAVGAYTMNINVLHVNKIPFIKASNFFTTAQSSYGIIVNESATRLFSWKAWDQDSLPNTLTTQIRVSFFTTQGFSFYQCTGTAANWANDADCTFDASVPFRVRSDFTKNAKKVIGSYSTVTTSCPDFNTLKLKYGAVDTGCEAHFKFSFAPTPGSSDTPYIAVNFVAVDDYHAESASITALIYVKAINSPPTISSPAVVLAASGITNPFIRNTQQDSASFNQPIVVGDDDSNGNAELLTISVNQGFKGELIWPSSANCWVDANNSQIWYCQDRIASFNQWLGDLRFDVRSGNQADLTFTINDLGFSSDYRPSPSLTASSQTSIKLTAAITAPTGNSSTLAIAVGVAAAAGLLLLGALGFFLRRAVAPPKDDYFNAAVTPLSAAPQSPLYQPQNTTFENSLYKGQN